MTELYINNVHAEVFEFTSDFIRGNAKDKREAETCIRNLINGITNNGNTSIYQSIRRNSNKIFEFTEGIVDGAIDSYASNRLFLGKNIEAKNHALENKSPWFTEGGILSVFVLDGNHFNTSYKNVDLASEYFLREEWIYIDVYDEVEKFMLGVVPFENVVSKVYEAVDEYIEDRLPVCFNNITPVVSPEFNVIGGDKKSFDNLCDMVQMAGGYDNLIIAGTQNALSKLYAFSIEDDLNYHEGHVIEWNGNRIMPINQSKQLLSDNQLFVLSGNDKPIKLELFGNTRSFMEEASDECEYLYVKYLVQTSIGLGLLAPEHFGCFTFKD